jgi:hypothetical protein
MINTLLRYFAIGAVLITLMGVTHFGMRMISGGQANAEFTPRPAGRDGHGGHGGAGHMLGWLLIVGVVGTAVVQISQRTRRPTPVTD